jgi:hypothetical protein
MSTETFIRKWPMNCMHENRVLHRDRTQNAAPLRDFDSPCMILLRACASLCFHDVCLKLVVSTATPQTIAGDREGTHRESPSQAQVERTTHQRGPYLRRVSERARVD